MFLSPFDIFYSFTFVNLSLSLYYFAVNAILYIMMSVSELIFLFPPPGSWRLQLSESNEYVVTLRKIDLASQGIYRCEVMSEAPTFQTSFASANLTVVGK